MNFSRFDCSSVSLLSRSFAVAAICLVVAGTGVLPARAGMINEPDPTLSAAMNAAKVKTGVRYWIELNRKGKTSHVTNQQTFLNGDRIRFHVQATVDGYAYIVLRSGSQGEQAVLFPQEKMENNRLNRETDYALPAEDYLTFDEHPGTEKVTLLFSKTALDPTKVLAASFKDANHVVLTAPSQSASGSKDLIPARTSVTYQSVESLTRNDSTANLYDSVNGAKPDQGMINSVIAMSTPDTGYKPQATVAAGSTAQPSTAGSTAVDSLAADAALAKANQELRHSDGAAAAASSSAASLATSLATSAAVSSSANDVSTASGSSPGSKKKPAAARISSGGSGTTSKVNTASSEISSGPTPTMGTIKPQSAASSSALKSSTGAVIVRQDDPEKVLHIDVDLEHSGS